MYTVKKNPTFKEKNVLQYIIKIFKAVLPFFKIKTFEKLTKLSVNEQTSCYFRYYSNNVN